MQSYFVFEILEAYVFDGFCFCASHLWSIKNLGSKDKNPDDPLAASRFIQITKAYQALTEPWIDVFFVSVA